jgi:hypothetical protein
MEDVYAFADDYGQGDGIACCIQEYWAALFGMVP